MADHTVKRIDEVEAVYGGGFLRLRAALGVRSFGMQIIQLPAGFDGHPEHDHLGTGQEEVYVVLNGSGEIDVDGERIPIDRETFVRVGPASRRKLYAGSEGLRVLALGGVPGEAYRPPHFTELGASGICFHRSAVRRLSGSRAVGSFSVVVRWDLPTDVLGRQVGHLTPSEMRDVEDALLLVLGLR